MKHYPRIFTPLFERLQSCMQPVAEFEALATEIAKALRNQMYKKNIWRDAKPEWLGKEYEDYTTWNNAEAFEDLCLACYMAVICKRFNSLQNKLSDTDNIDGYIHRNIGFFLYEAQRKADPVGHKVAIKIRLAVNCCATERGIITLDEKNKIHNKTLLIFRQSNSVSKPEPSVLADTIKKILHHNHSWTTQIYKLASLGRISQKDQVQICDIVADIAQQLTTAGINNCQFKSLVDVMKQEVRAVNPQERAPEEAADEIPFEPDDLPEEDFECWRVWCSQMKAAFKKTPYQKRVREMLPKVFAEREAAVEQLETSPPQAQIAKHLGMAVSTVNEHLKRIRELAEIIEKPIDCDFPFLDYLIGRMLK
ncbi:hypothetical protein PN36_15090 [Candidatus Thiomargarita nelsonii]|uniref:Uncharacterized protein n=1 Tax=Candidatus Thiomargarita nelsonii TaxID=1003181 RepID=A0A4E0QPQ7_9GAMM|nr:hypothetical protein PN36_15090 [Candidatus Thiomargarita nelsonii]